jgi:hypothetical protein
VKPQKRLISGESADNRSNERSLPIDLVRDGRARPLPAALQSEIPILRHQLNVLRRNRPSEWPSATSIDCCLSGSIASPPEVLEALKILKPETVLRWHRTGFRRWKARSGGGRPKHVVVFGEQHRRHLPSRYQKA